MQRQMPGRPGGGGRGGGRPGGGHPGGGRHPSGHPPAGHPPGGHHPSPPPPRPMGRFFYRHPHFGTPIIWRRSRRIRWLDYILFGIGGSPYAWCFSPWQLAQIEAYYGIQAEMLTEAQMLAAMQALNIQAAQLNAEQQARMQQIDEKPNAPSTAQTPQNTPSGPATRRFCPSCGAPVHDPEARFCEACGYEFR